MNDLWVNPSTNGLKTRSASHPELLTLPPDECHCVCVLIFCFFPQTSQFCFFSWHWILRAPHHFFSPLTQTSTLVKNALKKTLYSHDFNIQTSVSCTLVITGLYFSFSYLIPVFSLMLLFVLSMLVLSWSESWTALLCLCVSISS